MSFTTIYFNNLMLGLSEDADTTSAIKVARPPASVARSARAGRK